MCWAWKKSYLLQTKKTSEVLTTNKLVILDRPGGRNFKLGRPAKNLGSANTDQYQIYGWPQYYGAEI